MLTERLRIWIMAAVVAITFFVNNRTLQPDIMESRNLVTAREMVETGEWLVPTMNGDLRLEKPPLPTWVSAIVESVSPDDIAMQRAVASLFGILLVVFFYLLCRDAFKVDPVDGVLLLCTCYQFMLMVRTVSWDIYTHAFMLGAIYFLVMGVRERGRQWCRFLLAGLFAGLSVMSKGPVSLFALFLPFVIAWGVFGRPSMRGKWGPVGVMVLVTLIVGGWWYAYIQIFHGEEWQAVMAKETGSWLNRNVRPWYYYWKFFLEAGVWALLLVTATVMVLRRARRMDRSRLVPVMWMLLCLVLLSCMPEKKTRYLLPLLIPAAIVMAQGTGIWRAAFMRGSSAPDMEAAGGSVAVARWPFRLNCWLLAAVCVIIPVAAYIMLYGKGLISMPLWIVVAVLSLVAAWLLVKAAIKLRPQAMVMVVACYYALLVAFAFPVVGKLINNTSMENIGPAVNTPQLKDYPIYSPADEELRIEMVYQARRNIRPVDISSPDAVGECLPMILMTHDYAGNCLGDSVLAGVDTIPVGIFDCNRRPKGTRRYSPLFIYHLTLLRPSQQVDTIQINTPDNVSATQQNR
ncbi:MAG: glycosyltransferase family 39 protein [Muribaculaceae bacterium]|nr:glycosyltransferase family 39 protein [Muribaculaceae bacterium]